MTPAVRLLLRALGIRWDRGLQRWVQDTGGGWSETLPESVVMVAVGLGLILSLAVVGVALCALIGVL